MIILKERAIIKGGQRGKLSLFKDKPIEYILKSKSFKSCFLYHIIPFVLDSSTWVDGYLCPK